MRRRILTSIVAVTALAIALFGIPLAFAIHNLYLSDARAHLERMATLATRELVPVSETSAGSTDLAPPAKGVTLGLYSVSGSRLRGQGPAVGEKAVLQAAHNQIRTQEIGDLLVSAVPVTSNQQVVAVVRAETSAHGAEHRTHIAWLLMAILGAAIIAVAGVLAIVQANRLTRPLRRLRDTASRLGRGDFTIESPHAGLPEVDEVGRALTVSARRLGDAMAREQALSSHASHQLRTPIAGLRVTLETELSAPRSDSTLALEECLVIADRLETTVNDLVRLARERATDERLDFGAVAAHVSAHWAPVITSAERSLRVSCPSELPAVHAATAAIRQAVDVLLDNAYRHGGGAVELSVEPVAGGVALRVTDEGPGVPQNLERLFDGDPHRGGRRGIGLPLARTLVETEGGRLRLQGRGPNPCFEIVLPTQEGAAGVVGRRSASGPRASVAS
jgi:signal transduction histidine kinase